jgi:hypothetical protein
MAVKNAAPSHMKMVDSGGSTTPRPMPTADSGNLPLLAMRAVSSTIATSAPHIMAQAAETGSTPHSLRMPSTVCTSGASPPAEPMPSITFEIAAHCSAPGTAQRSDTCASMVEPGSWFDMKSTKKSGVDATAPATIPMQWPHACWRGLAPSMYPGLMSISRFDALDATSVVTPAVIRLVPGLVGCIAPKVNCVILESDPVGVVLVSAVALAAMSVSTMISGMESAPSHGLTPNHS